MHDAVVVDHVRGESASVDCFEPDGLERERLVDVLDGELEGASPATSSLVSEDELDGGRRLEDRDGEGRVNEASGRDKGTEEADVEDVVAEHVGGKLEAVVQVSNTLFDLEGTKPAVDSLRGIRR